MVDDVPLYFLASLLNLVFVFDEQLLEVVWVDIKVVIGHAQDFLLAVVLLLQRLELCSQHLYLVAHLLLFLFGHFEAVVFLSSELGLLDGVDGFVNNVRRVLRDAQGDCQQRLINFFNLFVDFGNVRHVFILEFVDSISQALLCLRFRHKLDAIDPSGRIEASFLLDHELVNQMDKNQAI